MTAPRTAKLAYLTEPSLGVFLLNLQFEDEQVSRIAISKAQLGNILVDGAGMALRHCSVRLGPESLMEADT